MSHRSDLEIIASVLGGNTNDYAVIVRKYRDRVYRYACSFCGNEDDAKEISQDVLIAAFESLKNFRGESQFSTWLYSITMNHCKNFARKRGRMRKVSISEMEETYEQEFQLEDLRESTENKVLLAEAYSAAMEELAVLPDDYKQAVILRDVEEMSYDDISKVLSISMSNVKVRIHRGREMLKKRMCERGLL
jgi:RNA polymerase sigma-70 factor (ECF subfamily)